MSAMANTVPCDGIFLGLVEFWPLFVVGEKIPNFTSILPNRIILTLTLPESLNLTLNPNHRPYATWGPASEQTRGCRGFEVLRIFVEFHGTNPSITHDKTDEFSFIVTLM